MRSISRGLLFSLAAVALSPPGIASATCTCVNKGGALYELGERVCIRVNGKAYLAECQMNLNNTSWQKVADECPIASLSGSFAESHWMVTDYQPI